MAKEHFYVTTSIPYVNGEPHIGTALEFVQADVIARYARQQGEEVLFSTGTDEHGTKVMEKAQELGKQPKAYVDELSAKFKNTLKILNISNDRFIRTTDAGHEQRSQNIWKALKGDIYKGTYVGLYDVTQEEFVPESQADPARLDPKHPKAYRKLEEENYFFKLSKYAQQIEEAITSDAFLIIPESKKNEVLGALREGLEDISISRPTEKLSWGVPVPGDKSQVMYVWFEALMNYITVLGYPEHEDFKIYWPANVQVIGKDILRFHALIWPAILFGLGLPLPKTLYVHGFIGVDGEKMSKSVGNVIAPDHVIKNYGVDPLRYFLMRHISSSDDGDFTWQKFEDAYNNELANDLGNAVSRVSAMISRYQEGVIGEIPEPNHDTEAYHESLESCRFDKALEAVWEQVRGVNVFIEEEKPWAIAKEGDAEHLKEVLAEAVGSLMEIAELLAPFIPETSDKIISVFSEGIISPVESPLFPKKEQTDAVG